MQKFIAEFDGEYRILEMPHPHERVMAGVLWGRHDEFLTPAFWASRVWLEGDRPAASFRLGETFVEETVACLLGGYGIPAEIGLAAFERVRNKMRRAGPLALDIMTLERLLSEPLHVNGKVVRYRFAKQKARYLAVCLTRIALTKDIPSDDLDLREWLLDLPGIGFKTASWIVRNWLASDNVAIIDTHICRACRFMGIFPANADASRDYLHLEELFLRLAKSIDVRPSILDAVIWATMKTHNSRVENIGG